MQCESWWDSDTRCSSIANYSVDYQVLGTGGISVATQRVCRKHAQYYIRRRAELDYRVAEGLRIVPGVDPTFPRIRHLPRRG